MTLTIGWSIRIWLKLALFVFVSFCSSKLFAQGGPPLVTDDPGTPGNGHWEINSAGQWTNNQYGSNYQFPLFDVNYGYGERIQLNLISSFITTVNYGAGSTSGLSLASTAVKWRFIDEDRFGVAISTYPRVDFHHPLSSANPAINLPGNRFFLPFEFAKKIGKFGLNPEIGFASYTQSSSEWVYGFAMSYEFEKEKEILFEIHGRNLVNTPDRELFLNLGTRYHLTDQMMFIGALGKTITAYPDDSISLITYLGVQLHF